MRLSDLLEGDKPLMKRELEDLMAELKELGDKSDYIKSRTTKVDKNDFYRLVDEHTRLVKKAYKIVAEVENRMSGRDQLN